VKGSDKTSEDEELETELRGSRQVSEEESTRLEHLLSDGTWSGRTKGKTWSRQEAVGVALSFPFLNRSFHQQTGHPPRLASSTSPRYASSVWLEHLEIENDTGEENEVAM
jgi:hypothetical protein